MKKVIDRKRYDTDTATRIATAESSAYRNDFRYWEESLYRTPKGAFFIAGEGGAMTRYATPVGNNAHTGGEGLRVVSRAEATEWLEQHDLTAALEEHFSDALEDA